MQLTENFTSTIIDRCAILEYSNAEQKPSHFYDCINNKDCFITTPFKYTSSFHDLGSHTNLITGRPIAKEEETSSDDELEKGFNRTERPVGTQRAKRIKQEAKESEYESREKRRAEKVAE